MSDSYKLDEANAKTAEPVVQNLYTSNTANSDANNLAKAGFDLSVSQNTEPKSSLEIAQKGELIIENIVQQATNTKESEDRILDELEQMDASLEVTLPVSANSVSSSKSAKAVFIVAMIFTFLSASYYFGIANTLFGLGSINYVSASQQKLVELQTEKTLNHYILVAISLDELAIRVSNFNASLLNNQSSSKLLKQKTAIVDSYSKIKNNLDSATKEVATSPSILTLLSEKVETEKSKYANLALKEEDELKKTTFHSLSKLYFSTQKVISNPDLRKNLIDINIQNLSDLELIELSNKTLGALTYNPIAQVASVELNRINWTTIFSELETVIQEFDPQFDVFTSSQDYTISLSSYGFNTESKTVTVSGEVRTKDSKTFTLITNIVDALETSDVFSNLSYTTFSKSLEAETEVFTSSLSLNFQLENNQ
jgi:hypothetical protein